MKLIKEFVENDKISQNFLVNNVTRGITAKGSGYLNIVLQDSSGTIEAKKWEIEEFDEKVIKQGSIIFVEGDVLLYKNDFQLKVSKVGLVNDADLDVSQFIASAPVSRNDLQKVLFEYVEKITDKEIKRVVEEVIKNHYISLSNYPAATKNHHEYASGLLHHTTSMLKVGELLSTIYTVNTSLLFAGIILHDIGKTIELSGPILPKYTTAGKLLGHISIINAEVAETCKNLGINGETSVLLQHMILSHHGQYDFGSPVLPMTKEAELLHFIDNIDSRMTAIDKALNQIEEGEFTPRQFALEDRNFYKPFSKGE
ncbi:MAG: HD domain-containing protein [Bacilli bacterium]|nr:HD domain-containing protein [Bacilli bacterium]